VTKIEGVPEGWELVRIDRVLSGEWYVDMSGDPIKNALDGLKNHNYVIIRKLETWRPATFNDIGCERARFKDECCDEWTYGKLMGASFNIDGSVSWIMYKLGRTQWVQICEVCEK
jgi:hypothetical protein